MNKSSKKTTLLGQAKSWATKNKLFGTQAFLRFIIFNFVEKINQVSADFVFKGGNLLWIYIKTPRATIDLDLATIKFNSHNDVKNILERICISSLEEEIVYSIMFYKEIEIQNQLGAAVSISYKTKDGPANKFEIDIVYALETDFLKIYSPVHGDKEIICASIENIIADKITTCHRFKAGNSRMKDFDDLWRLSKENISLDITKLKRLIEIRKSDIILDSGWATKEMQQLWSSHIKRYNDLPESLDETIREINKWLKRSFNLL